MRPTRSRPTLSSPSSSPSTTTVGTTRRASGCVCAKAQVKDGIIANGPDGVFGDFNLAHVNSLIKSLSPIYAKERENPKAGLTAPEIVTNRSIDPGTHLPA